VLHWPALKSSSILKQRLQFWLALFKWPIVDLIGRGFPQSSTGFSQRARKVPPIRIVQQIVDARDCHAQVARAVVQRLKKLLR